MMVKAIYHIKKQNIMKKIMTTPEQKVTHDTVADYININENKRTIKLNESELSKLVCESVKKVLNSLLKETTPARIDYQRGVRGQLTKVYRMKWDYRYVEGIHREKTVKEVYNSGTDGKNYVAWAYYNNPMIDYDQTIMDALGLIPIQKPGTDKQAYEQWYEQFISRMPENQRTAHEAEVNQKTNDEKIRLKRKKQLNYNQYKMAGDGVESKNRMAWRNQGHNNKK